MACVGLVCIGETNAGQGADKFAATTMHSLGRACAAGYGAPPRFGLLPLCQQPCLLRALFAHLRNRVKIWGPDAASDQRSVGLSLRRERLGATSPCLETRTVDLVHVARRAVPRLWGR